MCFIKNHFHREIRMVKPVTSGQEHSQPLSFAHKLAAVGAAVALVTTPFMLVAKAPQLDSSRGNELCQKFQDMSKNGPFLPSPAEYCVGEECPPQLSDTHEVIDLSARDSMLSDLTWGTYQEANRLEALAQQGSWLTPVFPEHSLEYQALQAEKELLNCATDAINPILETFHKHEDYYRANYDYGLRTSRGHYLGKTARDFKQFRLTPKVEHAQMHLFELCRKAADRITTDTNFWLTRATETLTSDFSLSVSHESEVWDQLAGIFDRLASLNANNQTFVDEAHHKAARWRDHAALVRPFEERSS